MLGFPNGEKTTFHIINLRKKYVFNPVNFSDLEIMSMKISSIFSLSTLSISYFFHIHVYSNLKSSKSEDFCFINWFYIFTWLRIDRFFFNRLRNKRRRNRRQEGPRDACSTTEDLELLCLHSVAERDPMLTPKMCLFQKLD